MARTTSIIALAIITIVTALSILAAAVPKPALALAPPSCQTCGPSCQTCGPKEDITGNGLGTLTCSNGASYTNTQINFNAIVPFKTIGPAKGTMTLTATAVSQVQGMVTSGVYDPSMKTYSLSGTSTSDSACVIPGSPFTISGIIGPEVQITMGGGKYAFQGTGDVTASNAKA